jgi:DoxX.
MDKIKSIAVNLCRLLLAVVFIFSGYVKATDPLGTQYKIQDYLEAVGALTYVPDFVTLATSVLLSALEFSLGIFFLFAIRRRLTSKITLLLMIVMTLVTLWLAIANPVKDCGCFGDAIKLTNNQTFLKNVVLLLAAVVVWKWPLCMYRFISKSNQWIAINYTVLFVLITSLYSLYKLPIFDFRPYHIGANIPKGMEIPEGAEQPQFRTTFIMEKDGVRKEFALENYPDSTWQFIDSKTVQTKEGYVPPIHDFSIQMAEGDDITEDVLAHKGYTFLLISPHLETADDSNFGNIDQIYEYAQAQKIPFYCLTASTEKGIQHWEDITGAEYPFYMTDATTLKTIIRSNPGLLLIKDGTIIRKWSHNDLPTGEELNAPLDKLEIGHLPNDTAGKTITKVVLWFFLPLILLTIADRTWAWSKYVRGKIRDGQQRLKEEEKKLMDNKTSTKFISTFKKEKNEKENCSR